MRKNIVLFVGLLLIGSILISTGSAFESRADDETPESATEVFFGDVKDDDLNVTTDKSDWYKINLKAGALITLNLTVPDTGDFDLYLYNSELVEVDWSLELAMGGFEQIIYTVPEPGLYYINCTAFDGNGSYRLKISVINPPDDDNDVGNATVIQIGQTKTSNMDVESVDLQDWYQVSISEGDHITVSLLVPNSGEYDLEIYDPNVEYIDGSFNNGDGDDEEVTFIATMTGFHYIYCNAWSGSGSYSLLVSKNMPPEISSLLPVDINVTVNEGETVLFNVTVDDENVEALTYEWNVDGEEQTNESGNTFEIVTGFVGEYSAGNYEVEVLVTEDSHWNQTDLFVWNLTVLDVNQIPEVQSFTPNVTNVTINEGEQLTLSVNVTDIDGTVPVYQWYLDDAAIANETSSGYTFTTDYDSEGTYLIKVNVIDEMDNTSVESLVWTVTVVNTDRAPVIAAPSGDPLVIDELGWFTLSINATDPDGDNITFEWFFDDVLLVNETSEDYSFTADYDSADGLPHEIMAVITAGGHVINFTWKLTINNVNRLPVIDESSIKPIGDTVLTAGEAIDFSVDAADPDGDVLSYTWAIKEGDTFLNQSFNTTLPAGTYNFTITVEDGNGGTDSFPLTVTVNTAASEPVDEESEDSYLMWIIIAIVLIVIIVIIIVVIKKKND